MEVTAIRTDGLGDMSYVLVHDGLAAVVDPQRDIERFTTVVDDAGAELAYVFETHMHNDYVSGGRDLAAALGADLVLPAGSGAAFSFRPAFHREPLELGDVLIEPLHTPGHTPEHVSYVVLVDGSPVAIFSGGSLLVGSAGRTDLLGVDPARQLARLQYGSVRRLAELPGTASLYPTHGQGSFCTTGGTTGAYTSTIERERSTNGALQHGDADSFADAQLSGLQPYPAYYRHMGPMNKLGPARPETDVKELTVGEIPGTAAVVDIRDSAAYAAGHLPGSLGIPASDTTAVWAGWLLPFDSDVVLVADRGQDVKPLITQFMRIGFDHVVGVVRDLEDRASRSYRTATAREAAEALQGESPPLLVDVRSPGEWEIAHVPGSRHAYVPDLRDGLDGTPEGSEVWLACGSGFRATVAAGLVEELGLHPVVLTGEGVSEILAALD